MRVIIYLEGFSKDFPDENEKFLIQLFDRVTELSHESEFIFLTNSSNEKIAGTKNCLPVLAAPTTGNSLLWKAWLDLKLPALLKKYRADIFIGNNVCSLTTTTPQCLIITNSILPSLDTAKKKQVSFYKRNLPKFLKKAKSIVCFSGIIKNEIIKTYGNDKACLQIIPPAAAQIFRPLNETAKNNIKKKLTEGKEYFICMDELNDRKSFIDLLKAFSIFKKMQQSNMKLVLTGKITTAYKNFSEDFKTYKYKDAVLLTEPATEKELAELIASAYALILISADGLGVRALQAMQSEIPVIAVKGTAANEIAGDAAMYFNANEHSEIANQMMYLYKDEDQRKSLIEKGKKTSMNYSMDRSAKLLWQTIEDALR